MTMAANAYHSPVKERHMPEGGITTQNRLQSARSEGSFIETNHVVGASPYLTQLLSGSKLQSSARGDGGGLGRQAAEVNMEELWRFGIPMRVRRELWPFKIGNKLGISKELYYINRSQGKALYDKVMARRNGSGADQELSSNIQSSGHHVPSTYS